MFTHHAYLVTNGTCRSVRNYLESEGIPITGNPDIVEAIHDALKIEDARNLIREASLRPVGDRRFFILETGSILPEAQNALLKLFEEPNANVHFFVCVPQGATILPTLRSRLSELPLEEEAKAPSSEAAAFLKQTVAERLDVVGKLVDGQDRNAAIAFVEALLDALAVQKAHTGHVEKRHQALETLITARQLLNERGGPLKQPLEYLAASTPRFS